MDSELIALLELGKQRIHSDEERGTLERAYNFAKKAHEGQKRRSGEHYFTHLLETASLVARWGMDVTTITAALLHDVLEDTSVTLEELTKEFGEEVAFLVNGVTKISRIKYRGNLAQTETLKKMILALSEDVRVVFVKLADRMHNMRTLKFVPPDKQKRIALETSEIYAPLAYRMGLGAVSGELEDLAFPFLHPEAYRSLQHELREHLNQGEKYITRVKERISKELGEQKVPVIRIDARVKRISSLYKKLQRYDMNMDRVYDLLALRVIVTKVEECYWVLGVIHSLWPPLPGHIKDYIALPKPNGYRSLHTTVIALDNKPTEFQIRTDEMHNEAEYGIAAYWAYQEAKPGWQGSGKQAVFADARQLAWINQLKTWQLEMEDQDEFIASLKIDFFKDRIFVITPKGEAIDLPAGATPIDFAYAIHSHIGDHCVGAKVNGRMVSLDFELESGDVVEILTQKSRRPNLAWLTFVKTRHARQRIRHEQRVQEQATAKTVTFIITALDRVGLLKDIASVFSAEKINILSFESPKGKAGSVQSIKVTAGSEANAKVDQLTLKLRSLHNVQRIKFRRP